MDTGNKSIDTYRTKLRIHEQIDDMKKKGIRFSIISEYQAREFLRKNNFYFKLKAFEKNYDKLPTNNPALIAKGIAGQYSGLEFAYLQELSTLDMYFRNIVLNLSLSVEHFLRVRLMRDISENDAEDGYSIVNDYEQYSPSIKETIIEKKTNSYCEQLIDNYPGEMPVWVFLEVISFGDLIKFCKMYYKKYPTKELKSGVIDSLQTVRYIRNAAAHNNCLLNDLHPNNVAFSTNRFTASFVASIAWKSPNAKSKKLSNRTVHDFITLLYVFENAVTSQHIKKHAYMDLEELFNDRFILHKEYFRGNGLLESTYEFVKAVIDHLANLNS
ncbi:MAG: Abi family protein [Oscillospiraceae bacterium]|nr:Abi family protein [Oscillospiraceae bacterium]